MVSFFFQSYLTDFLSYLKSCGASNLNEIPIETLISNVSFSHFLSQNWNRFALLFPELSSSMGDIEYSIVSNSEKAFMVIRKLIESSTPVLVSLFIKNIEAVEQSKV